MIKSVALPLKLRQFRLEAGLTQKKLGEMVGVNESTIRNYELGNRMPSADKLEAIANALTVSFDALWPQDLARPASAMQVLFKLEYEFGLSTSMIDDKIHLTIDPAIALSSENSDAFERMIRLWHIAKEYVNNEGLSNEFYKSWENKFPNFSGVNPQGVPYIKTSVVSDPINESQEDDIESAYHTYMSASKWAGATEYMTFEQYKEFYLSNLNEKNEK